MNTASCCTFAPSSSPANCQMRMGGSIHPFQTSSLLASSVYPFCIIHTLSSSSVCNRAWPCNTRVKYTLSIHVSSKKPQTDTSHREALHVHSTLQGMLGLHSSIPPESGE